MNTTVLIYLGAGLIAAWGVSHIVPTRGVVASFGALSNDNRRILTMEWVAEGLTLIFLGVLVAGVTLAAGASNDGSQTVYWLAAAMLLVKAAWTLATGARTAIIPIKICPVVKTTAAVLIIAGAIL